MRTIALLLLMPLFLQVASANHLQVTNVLIDGVDNVNDFAMIRLDLSWENSWRDADNYDAAWVFIKYRIQGQTGAWQHATLHYVNGTNDGHTVPAGATISTPSDGKGVFVHRSANGSGTVNFTGVQLRWDYGTDGLSDADLVDIFVAGIEMVYVPQGSFYLGDGTTAPADIHGQFEAGTTGLPFQVTSEAALTLGGGGAGSLGNNNGTGEHTGGMAGSQDDFNDATTQALPAAFPKGYQAFYCMKYELSQAQYVDFLNLLDATQATARTSTGHFVSNSPQPFSYYRYGIQGTHPNFTTAHPYAPMVYLGFVEGAAYADWAGLRPLTELEFEKASRGPGTPIVGECPWGTSGVDLGQALVLGNTGAANEAVTSGYTVHAANGNCWLADQSQSGIETVARVGIMAAHASNTGRVTSGASYWGIFDMAGNAWERCVSVGNADGRQYTGQHGDGLLSAAGNANVPNWPGQFGSGEVTSNLGVGYRGAGFEWPDPTRPNIAVSNRILAANYWDIVLYDDGIRLVRTAP